MCPASGFGDNTKLPCGNGESGSLGGLPRSGGESLGDDEAWSTLCEWRGDVFNGINSAIRMKSVLFILSHLFEVRQSPLKCADPNAHQVF
jgi:hypothetical protein